MSKAFSEQLTKLGKEFRDVSNDLQRERVAARETQEEAKSLMRQLKESQEAIVRLTLIFWPYLYRNGTMITRDPGAELIRVGFD